MGRVAVGAMGGEVEVDPVSGARRVRGDLVDLGGFALTGVVTVRGEPDAAVRVILPASVDLEGGDGRTARVTGLVTDLSAAPRLGPDGRLQFRFGGRLLIAGLDDGDYRGRIPVKVEYPYGEGRSEEHTSELQSLMRISYAVFCLKKKKDRKRYTI